MSKSFEEYWAENGQRILNEDKEYQEVKASYKVSSGADLILLAIPVAAGIGVFEWAPAKSEWLNWLIAAVVVIVAFALCTFIKTLMMDSKSIIAIEKRVKEECKRKYEASLKEE